MHELIHAPVGTTRRPSPLQNAGQLIHARGGITPATEPPEVRGTGRDDVRLLVGSRSTGAVAHHRFTDLPDLLGPRDLLVVNTSATIPAAVDLLDTTADDGPLVVHFSTELPDRTWVVELRARRPDGATDRSGAGSPGARLAMAGGATLTVLDRYSEDGRLLRAAVDVPGSGHVLDHLARHGRPIRYGYVDRDWPLTAYQTVFARRPGSAEMPSAGRPFTETLLRRLAAGGTGVASIELHTGVASLEAGESPYPERFVVSAAAARAVRRTRATGGRVVAVGTTVVRALESALDGSGEVRAAHGWTDLVVTPGRGVHAVDGLLTGLHEPAASHLLMLEAVAGRPLLRACYAEALREGYLWHEFGDLNLLLP